MKKRIADLSPEEQEKVRAYNRAQKAMSRAKQKAMRYVPTASEAFDSYAANHPDRVKELDVYVKDFAAKVSKELCRELGSIEEECVIDRVARCVLGLKRGWVDEVMEPFGEIVSGKYFADVSGDMVESANRHGLKQSSTFAATYRELLEMLDKRYGYERTEDAAIIRAELAGTYALPPLPEPKPELKPEPPKIQDPPLPSVTQILHEGRIKTLELLQSQTLPPEARRYLDGTL
jgi:hypothetical protein